ncbi:AraC family transcriptional regulator [Mesorhizobium sp. B2-4-17]|uniref:AraC family transcriptional regulator n=1 Tax=Mesorhizobium sp. B2-4-17 TaxID=2589932 RepID=UPI0011272518|nr:AraC family transcriptional regulator [Mesorhizobium sp. B2-4-17]TPK78121.1 helix-turn-helix transcriptional regulator [Mesorhizobium sp. B2-4-17]
MGDGRRYGDVIAHSHGIGDAPSIVTRSLRSAQVGVTKLSCGHEKLGRTTPIPAEDTFILTMYPQSVEHHELWRGGKRFISQGYDANSIRIVHLGEEFSARVTHPHMGICFYIPRTVLDDFSDDAGERRVADLACTPGVVDPVLGHLAASLLPMFQRPEEVCTLVVDHVALAVCSHLQSIYGGLVSRRPMARGGLSPAAETRAKDYLASSAGEDITLADVASACRLSRGHFIRAFRTSTGLTPHKWLQRHRVEKAKALFLETDISIAEIAVLCGFADQSHLTRVFTALIGVSPALWRRERRSSWASD